MSSFELFPKLNNDLFEESSISIEPYSFSYISDNIEYDLDYDFENNEYIILDQKNIWNVKDYNLKFKTNLTIDNPQVLFGKNGIVPHNASINIALQWMSKPSQKRDTRKIGAFSIKDTFVNKTISMDIKPDRLKEYVKIRVIFTVGDCENILPNEMHLANKKGMIVGMFNEAKIMLEGKGSEFPIATVSNGVTKPLWMLEYSSINPEIDKFSAENVCLLLNTDHPDYKYLDEENLESSTPLFKEIFSSAILMILLNLDKDGYLEKVKDNEDFEEGSICAAMHYFIRTFNIKADTIISMMQSVKENVYKEL